MIKRKSKRSGKPSGKRQNRLARRGLMLVLSSPSGAGKTTLSRMLLGADKSIELSISITTRPRRRSEINGRHYHFVSKEKFAAMRRAGGLLEWAEVFGHYYGTPRVPVERALVAGKDVLFDVDWQGANQLKRKVGNDLVTVFVLPPSARELGRRLKHRAQDTEAVIRHRMAGASREMSHWDEYDYVLVNYDLDRAFGKLRAILTAERLKGARQTGLANFVRDLRKKL